MSFVRFQCRRTLLYTLNKSPRNSSRAISQRSAIKKGIRESNESLFTSQEQWRMRAQSRRQDHRRPNYSPGHETREGYRSTRSRNTNASRAASNTSEVTGKARDTLGASRKSFLDRKDHQDNHAEGDVEENRLWKNNNREDFATKFSDRLIAPGGAFEPGVESLPLQRKAATSHKVDLPAGQDEDLPIAVPRSTAASVFLYGYNIVLAALQAQRRRLYKLHINSDLFTRNEVESLSPLPNSRERRKALRAASRPESQSRKHKPRTPAEQEVQSKVAKLLTLAKAANIPINDRADARFLDKISIGRPHNGIALEASTIPAPPLLNFGRYDLAAGAAPIKLAHQNLEEKAVHGAPEHLKGSHSNRYPLVLMLDGIQDPVNIGSILRTAHFYGVDAIGIASATCANLASPVLARTSSGACESAHIFDVRKPSGFLYDIASAGWQIYAAVAPPQHEKRLWSTDLISKHCTISDVARQSPLSDRPCVLVLGGEGDGLRENLRRRSDFWVSIEQASRGADFVDVGVDSLNVGVAAGVLIDAFVQSSSLGRAHRTFRPTAFRD